MDNLTHSLVGAVLGQAGLKRKTGLAMPALIIGANLPDIDAACFVWLHGTEHLAFRRGITHGPPALVLLPLILAGMLWGFDRWQTKRGTRPEGRLPVRFGWLLALAFIGCLTHPAMDWLNVYGIRLLEPFSSRWFYGDTLFIIDPWIWAMLIAGIWLSRRREKAGALAWARPAQAGLAAMLVYIGVNAGISVMAASTLPLAEDSDVPGVVIASPVPFAFWERDVIDGAPTFYWHSEYSVLRGRSKRIAINDLCWVDPVSIYYRSDHNSQLDAFLFWSRAPVTTRAPDGSVILRDARFADPRVADRFSLALPDVRCEELPAP